MFVHTRPDPDGDSSATSSAASVSKCGGCFSSRSLETEYDRYRLIWEIKVYGILVSTIPFRSTHKYTTYTTAERL